MEPDSGAFNDWSFIAELPTDASEGEAETKFQAQAAQAAPIPALPAIPAPQAGELPIYSYMPLERLGKGSQGNARRPLRDC